jgi:MFS family permease
MRQFRSLTRDQKLLVYSGLLWGFGMSLFVYIQPLYISYLGATPEQIGLALGLSGLVVTVAYIPVGLWSDRRGRKPVIIAGWTLATLSGLAMALAPDWRWFIPAWSGFLLSNFALPAMNGYIAAGARSDQLYRTFTFISASSPVGSLLSPAIGGWIGQAFGLRSVYMLASIFFFLSTLVLLGLTPQSPQPVEKRTSRRTLLFNRVFLLQIGFAFLLFTSLELGQVMASKFLQDVRGWGLAQIGLMGSLGTLGIAVLTLTLGQMRQEGRRALITGQLLAVSAIILWAVAASPLLIGLAYFIHGSYRVLRPIVSAELAQRLDQSTMSLGYGFQQTAAQLGWALAPLFAGQLYSQNPHWPFLAGAAGLGLTLLLTFGWPSQAQAAQAAGSQTQTATD